MGDEQDQDGAADGPLEAVIAEYLDAVRAGAAVDRRRLLEAHPDIAAALAEFFANHDHLIAAVGSGEAEVSATVAGGERHGLDEPPRPGSETGLPQAPTAAIDPPPAADLSLSAVRPGARFGGYELLEEISRGGMGVVFKARQESLHRVVALKMIKSGQFASSDEVRRFRAEAEAAASLDHPGIVPIFEVGEQDGLQFFSMAHVAGESLADRVAGGPLPGGEAARLTLKIAEAVVYAHERGVIHRDLKPANVLLDARGQPKITDFGLAKNLNRDFHLTQTGQILGTPAYMAPEQARASERVTSPLVDVYALGGILYALATGRAPFEASTPLDVLLQVLDREPPRPTELNRSLPKPLEQICLRCLEKDPRHRYGSAAAVAADLERFLKGEPIEARHATPYQRLRRWARREPALAAHLGGIAATLGIVTVAHLILADDRRYFLTHVTSLLCWAAASVVLQKLMNLPRWTGLARVLWATVDTVLFTTILVATEPPRGPLLIGYPLLVTASGLFFRVRYVVFMTCIVVLAFLALVLLMGQDEPQKTHFCFIYAAGLVVLGSIVAAQVRRIRALLRYSEKND